MKAIALVLVLTCAAIVNAPLSTLTDSTVDGPCWHVDATTIPPTVRVDPECGLESQLSNAL